MDNQLVKQLQEKDLFPAPSKQELAQRKEKQKIEKARRQAVLDKLALEFSQKIGIPGIVAHASNDEEDFGGGWFDVPGYDVLEGRNSRNLIVEVFDKNVAEEIADLVRKYSRNGLNSEPRFPILVSVEPKMLFVANKGPLYRALLAGKAIKK